MKVRIIRSTGSAVRGRSTARAGARAALRPLTLGRGAYSWRGQADSSHNNVPYAQGLRGMRRVGYEWRSERPNTPRVLGVVHMS
jgi:hypothetical protein